MTNTKAALRAISEPRIRGVKIVFKIRRFGMIKHVVMWRMKPEVTEAQMVEMKNQLEALKGVVDELLEIEVGIDVLHTDQSADVVLSSKFNDLAGLKAYATHPAHVKVGEYIKPLVAERRAVDYSC
jgi:hypothetical protein